MCTNNVHPFFHILFSTFPGEKSIRIGYIRSGHPHFAYSTTYEPTCSYSYYTIVSSDVSFYSFKLHGLCVYVRGQWCACGCGMRVWMRGNMNERVTVIEGNRVIIWLARGFRWGSLEDYRNGWTFEISTIARRYFAELLSRARREHSKITSILLNTYSNIEMQPRPFYKM